MKKLFGVVFCCLILATIPIKLFNISLFDTFIEIKKIFEISTSANTKNTVLILETEKNQDESIIFNYIRLFGAESTPLFMRYIENKESSSVEIDTQVKNNIDTMVTDNPKCLLTDLWHQFSAASNQYIDFFKSLNVKNDQVGFLFLSLENNGNSSFYDIEIEYDEIKNSSPKEMTRIVLDTFPRKSEAKKIAVLRPHSSIIWLLNVYKTDKDGFPNYYLSDINIPKEITYLYNHKRLLQEIRPPYREKAMKVSLPPHWINDLGQYGWSGQ